MDYKKFRVDNGLSTRDIVCVLKESAPKYSKVHQSFIEHPDESGLCLLPSLDKLLIERFGAGSIQATKKENRRLKNKLTVRLPDDIYSRFAEIRAREGCTTQELLRDLIENWLLTTQDM